MKADLHALVAGQRAAAVTELHDQWEGLHPEPGSALDAQRHEFLELNADSKPCAGFSCPACEPRDGGEVK